MNPLPEKFGSRIRTATKADLPQIVSIFLRCWRLSYANLLTAEAIGIYDEESAGRLWSGLMERNGPQETIVVAGAVGAGEVAAVCRFERAGYLAGLYVDPDAQGSGLGRLLLAHAEMHWLAAGITCSRLWVFEENQAARSFYEHCGYRPSGRTRTDQNYREPEIEMTKIRSG